MPSNDKTEEGLPSSAEPQDDFSQRHEPSEGGVHHVYEDVTSAASAHQMNANTQSENVATHGPRNHYKKVRAEGQSYQMNGTVSSVEYFKAFFAPRCQQGISHSGYVRIEKHWQ